MKLGLRERLFVLSLLLVGVTGLLIGSFLDTQLRAVLMSDVRSDLSMWTQAAVEELAAEDDRELGAPAVADHVARITGARVTVVAVDGSVIADSNVNPAGLGDHNDRPEIVEARAVGPGAFGVALRPSDTLHADMLYVASAMSDGHVIRVAWPLSEMQAQVRRQRMILGLAAFIGLLVAGAMAGLGSHLATRELAALVARAHELAPRMGDVPEGEEVALLTGSMERIAEELERALGELAEERNRFEAVLTSMSDGVVAVDEDRRVIAINPAAVELLGIDPTALGRSLLETTGIPVLNQAVNVALDGGAGDHEIELATRSDPVRAQQLLVRAAPQQGGGAVLALRDVTELRRLERVRQDFVASVSHELRTPVSVVQSSAEALTEGALTDPVHGPRFARAILRHARRLGTLINDLLELARLDAGQRSLELAEVDLVAVAADAVASVGEHAGCAVRLEVGDVRVAADAAALEQVLVNLIGNAIQHQGHSGDVVVRATTADEAVLIEVVDEGPGIPEDERDRIFERFYRIDAGRSSESGGTGLGLSIVKHLVEAMRGSVGVRPNEPRGSVFWVRIGEGGHTVRERTSP